MPATPSIPGSAVAMAPEPATLLAAEPAAEVALPAAPVADAMRPVEEPVELPVLEEELPEELPVLEPEELELPVFDAFEAEEVAELPPVMLLRIEPARLLVCVGIEYRRVAVLLGALVALEMMEPVEVSAVG